MAGLRGAASGDRRVHTGQGEDLTRWAPSTATGFVSRVMAGGCWASPRRGYGCPSLTEVVRVNGAGHASIALVGDGPLPRLPGTSGGETVRERAPADRDRGIFMPGHDNCG